MNVVILCGEVRTEPERKTLPSGDVLISFDLRLAGIDGPRQSIPVTWIGPSGRVPRAIPESTVAVVGWISRRFYRGPSGSVGRVDVRATRIVTGGPSKRRRAITALLDQIGADLAA